MKGELRVVGETGVSIDEWDYSLRSRELKTRDLPYNTMESIEQYRYRMSGGLKAGLIVLGVLLALDLPFIVACRHGECV